MKTYAVLQPNLTAKLPFEPGVHAANGLAILSFAQLEQTLVAADLLLNAWRTTVISDAGHRGERTRRLARNSR